jgi:hypothetical protein
VCACEGRIAIAYLFPDIEPSEYSWEPAGFQSVVDLANGSRQVTEFSPFNQRTFSLRYSMEDESAMWTSVYPHFDANKARRFSFFDFWSIPWVTLIPFATGDGVTRTFYVSAKETTGLAIFVGGVSKPFTLAGIGPEGEDGITLSVANTPALGAQLAWTAARARRKFQVWYFGGANAPARIKPVPIEGGLWGAELQLIEEVAA